MGQERRGRKRREAEHDDYNIDIDRGDLQGEIARLLEKHQGILFGKNIYLLSARIEEEKQNKLIEAVEE